MITVKTTTALLLSKIKCDLNNMYPHLKSLRTQLPWSPNYSKAAQACVPTPNAFYFIIVFSFSKSESPWRGQRNRTAECSGQYPWPHLHAVPYPGLRSKNRSWSTLTVRLSTVGKPRTIPSFIFSSRTGRSRSSGRAPFTAQTPSRAQLAVI